MAPAFRRELRSGSMGAGNDHEPPPWFDRGPGTPKEFPEPATNFGANHRSSHPARGNDAYASVLSGAFVQYAEDDEPAVKRGALLLEEGKLRSTREPRCLREAQ